MYLLDDFLTGFGARWTKYFWKTPYKDFLALLLASLSQSLSTFQPTVSFERPLGNWCFISLLKRIGYKVTFLRILEDSLRLWYSANFYPKGTNRNTIWWATNLYKMFFLKKCRPAKNRSVHEVLWVYWCVLNCIRIFPWSLVVFLQSCKFWVKIELPINCFVISFFSGCCSWFISFLWKNLNIFSIIFLWHYFSQMIKNYRIQISIQLMC